MNQFFGQARWRVKAASVVEKLFAVIGGKRKDALRPAARAAERGDEAGHLFVNPADASVVECDDVIAVTL
jgi:hypothetical protein